ncbi:MAG: hypothetical protein GX592_10720 [Clostridiales bacterium]|nr:hypothetical protein [Clostridiales bacterium]
MKIEAMKTVCVVGAGDMGHGIAQLALMGDFNTNLCDVKMEFVAKGISRINASLAKLVAKGACKSEVLEASLHGRLRGFTSIADAAKDADLTIEVVSEKIPIKESVLRAISAAVRPDAIIATNTSTMSITLLSRFVDRPERFVGTHYFNPAVLMRLVEVIDGERTSKETAQFALDYVEKIGKISVHAKKDTPGFIANRINIPSVVYNGLCMDVDGISAEDIDATMMKTGLRMGPMELVDYTGSDILSSCLEYYREHLSPEYTDSAVRRKLLDAGKYGKKTGEGFYIWPESGRPAINLDASTGKYDPRIPYFIEANEACKLFEEGVCSLEDCDKAMEYGFNTPGPISFIRGYAPEEVAATLNRVAEHFGKEIFRPVDMIVCGEYRREK